MGRGWESVDLGHGSSPLALPLGATGHSHFIEGRRRLKSQRISEIGFRVTIDATLPPGAFWVLSQAEYFAPLSLVPYS